ncbi:metabolite traffic protein EboE [Stieleria sp. JC731]|uniref:metabolite traffic protein EboE n=1 Tax=Pirellulaceae TaxID=2691357 RepID=UPI001E5A4CFD|nr:metabolite traffic protein EboE [Stieleria sp. JC731]MCC9599174.1 metabolite traffic protein EboE [Stieleria sp. JC731]
MTSTLHLGKLASTQVGYCTNVHAGTDLNSIRENLTRYAVAVREKLALTRPCEQLGVGLWIPDEASRQLVDGELDRFAAFLTEAKLSAFTINGFPFANFHGDRVKQGVYLPTWADRERLEYTQRLATILSAIMPDDEAIGSISTLPIGWPDNPFANDNARNIKLDVAGANLRTLATFLADLHDSSGREITVAIEPEPGCTLDTVDDMVAFFDAQLPDKQHRQYISACHDICHSAVMNEPQRDAIKAYADAGISIGKVQVSSAIVADWKSIPAEQHADALKQLSEFAEDRYLHQTGQVDRQGGFRLATDLPELIRQTDVEKLAELDRWVIHFHVPIFLERFGLLQTTRAEVLECLAALSDAEIDVDFTGHLEAETYAWTVLPSEMRARGLAEDIAGELDWLCSKLV